jgi:hypothetical protein
LISAVVIWGKKYEEEEEKGECEGKRRLDKR